MSFHFMMKMWWNGQYFFYIHPEVFAFILLDKLNYKYKLFIFTFCHQTKGFCCWHQQTNKKSNVNNMYSWKTLLKRMNLFLLGENTFGHTSSRFRNNDSMDSARSYRCFFFSSSFSCCPLLMSISINVLYT